MTIFGTMKQFAAATVEINTRAALVLNTGVGEASAENIYLIYIVMVLHTSGLRRMEQNLVLHL